MTNVLFNCYTCGERRLASTVIDWGTMFEYKCSRCYKYTQISKRVIEEEIEK